MECFAMIGIGGAYQHMSTKKYKNYYSKMIRL